MVRKDYEVLREGGGGRRQLQEVSLFSRRLFFFCTSAGQLGNN